ncbi:uncharacterized protein [Amphiura filiformis]|uniref:uncharacterized protein n=1 Tax=Amphiura filiformis TaxID=82378 RepID=UPI003B20E89C
MMSDREDQIRDPQDAQSIDDSEGGMRSENTEAASEPVPEPMQIARDQTQDQQVAVDNPGNNIVAREVQRNRMSTDDDPREMESEPVASIDPDQMSEETTPNPQVPSVMVIPSEQNVPPSNEHPYYGSSKSLPPPAQASVILQDCKADSLPSPQPNKAAPLCPGRRMSIGTLQRQYALPHEDPGLEQLTGSVQTEMAPMMSHQPSSTERDPPSVGVQQLGDQVEPRQDIGAARPIGSLHTDNAWHVNPEQAATMRRSSPTSTQEYAQNAGREDDNSIAEATGMGGATGTLHTDDAWHMHAPAHPEPEYRSQRMGGQRQLVEMCTDDVAGESIAETGGSLLGAYGGGGHLSLASITSTSSSSGDSLEITEQVGATASANNSGFHIPTETHSLGLISNDYRSSRSSGGKVKSTSRSNVILNQRVQTLEFSIHHLTEEKREFIAQQRQQDRELQDRRRESLVLKREIEETKRESTIVIKECEERKRENEEQRNEIERLRIRDEQKDKQLEDLNGKMEEMQRQLVQLLRCHAPGKESK